MTDTIDDNTNVVYLKDFKKPNPKDTSILPDDYTQGYNDYIDDISLSVTFDITNVIGEYGFDIQNVPSVGYDLMMVIESVKSLLYRTQEEYYPLQDIAEDLFEIEDSDKLVDDFLNGE